MAILVVLLPASETEPVLQPAAARELAGLGVTSVEVVRDERTIALIVEGWSFDPHRSADVVVSAIGARRAHARTLHSVMHLAVSQSLAPVQARGV